jgi:hypothetical protein
MGVYTDPKLLDVRGALDVLPELPLDDQRKTMRQAVGIAAVKDLRPSQLAPVLAPTTDFATRSRSFPVRVAGGDAEEGDTASTVAT